MIKTQEEIDALIEKGDLDSNIELYKYYQEHADHDDSYYDEFVHWCDQATEHGDEEAWFNMAYHLGLDTREGRQALIFSNGWGE